MTSLASYFFFYSQYCSQHAALFSGSLISVGKSPNSNSRLLEIGDSGQVEEPGQVLETLLYDAGIEVNAGPHGPELSTTIRNRAGKVIVSMVRNNWEVSSEAWDKNYTKDRLEVLDERGHIVLQVHVLPDRIRLQGEWRDGYGKWWTFFKSSKGNGAIVGSGVHEPQPIDSAIQPMFEYPSRTNWRKLKPNVF